jgi:hypothetical protein
LLGGGFFVIGGGFTMVMALLNNFPGSSTPNSRALFSNLLDCACGIAQGVEACQPAGQAAIESCFGGLNDFEGLAGIYLLLN